MKAILNLTVASCLALTAGCTNLIEIDEGFKSKQTQNKSNPQEVETSSTQELSKPPAQIQTKSDISKQSHTPECIVLDPDDNYANARTTPNGAIVGPLANGTRVQVIGELNDSSGRPWSEVRFGNAGSTGYVFKRLLTSCE